MGTLEGRVAVVTGAGAGLGRAVALAFAAEGAHVVAVSIDAGELSRLRALAAQTGLRVDTEHADVSDPTRARSIARDLQERVGQPDILVNNAGVIVVAPIGQTSLADFDRVVATNLRGPFVYSQTFLEPMITRGDGTIINVSSQSGVRPFSGESAYCSSKFGLEGLTRTLALELSDTNVRIISVTPGAPMHTPMSETTYDAAAREQWVDPGVIAPGFIALALSDDTVSGGRYDAYKAAIGPIPAARLDDDRP